jgi:hypothetical protein
MATTRLAINAWAINGCPAPRVLDTFRSRVYTIAINQVPKGLLKGV